jgi:hypothetical protein
MHVKRYSTVLMWLHYVRIVWSLDAWEGEFGTAALYGIFWKSTLIVHKAYYFFSIRHSGYASSWLNKRNFEVSF